MSLRLLVLVAVLATGECFFGGAGKAPAKKVKATVKSKAPIKKAQTLFKKATSKAGLFDPASDIGVVPPLGLFDPLNLISRGPDAYRRYQEIEIKHGRIAMLATLGVITTEAGFRLPGYISFSQDLKFSDVPGSLDGAYFGIPIAGWVQIAAFIAALDIAVFRQDPNLPPGDVVQDLPIQWVRYDDPEVKAFKLNIERNNGRAAMMGILGMIAHTALGQDALYPIVSK